MSTSSSGSSTRRTSAHRSNGTAKSARSSSAASRSTPTPADALAEIKHDVLALRTDAVRLVHGIEEAAAKKVSRLTKRSKTEVEGVHEQIRGYIGQRPVVAVLVAFGVGAVLAKLIRR